MLTILIAGFLVTIVYINLDFFIKVLLSIFVGYVMFSVLFVFYWLCYAAWQQISFKDSYNSIKNYTTLFKNYIYSKFRKVNT